MPNRTLDFDAPLRAVRFFEDSTLGNKQALTREGFLICKDVPIARLGTMIYARGEIPLIPTNDGVIYVTRTADEVFRDRALLSFEGKPVTMDHPTEDVNPRNWKRYAVGTVQNVRRGSGIYDDTVVADLLITDAAAIAAVRAGRREVSCGYDAEYEQSSPGHGIQRNIVGNHVALVEFGRCGSRCSIGDKAMTQTSWFDRVRNAFRTRDRAGFEDALKEREEAEKGAPPAGEEEGKGPPPPAAAAEEGKGPPPPAGEDKGPPPPDGEKPAGAPPEAAGGTHHTIVVNVGGAAPTGAAGAPAATVTEGDGSMSQPGQEGMPPGGAPGAPGGDPIAMLSDAVVKLDQRLSAIEQALAPVGNAAGAGGGGGFDQTQDAAPMSPAEIEALRDEHVDTRARAEILVPGIRLSTFDAQASAKATRDSICAIRRRAITAAWETARGQQTMHELYDGKEDIAKMTCDAVKTIFVVASERARDLNNYSAAHRDDDRQKKGIRTVAEINERNRQFWNQPTH